jgi:DNA-binding NarL/FixJ family response regulator
MSAPPLKVLIVDDSKLARMSIAKALKSLHPDCMVVEAANADEAQAAAKRTPVDIALLDYNMPGRNGLLLGAELRSLDPKMPLAIVSANTQAEIVDGTERLGATFLPKPLTARDLRAFLEIAMARPR